MNAALVVAIAAPLAALVGFLVMKELSRRKKWFQGVRAALGAGFSEFAPRASTDLVESAGELEGRTVVFAADRTIQTARLEVPLRDGVDKGRVFDLLIREAGGALETGADDVTVGWDDERDRLVFRGPCDRDPEKTVKALVSGARSFQEKLPEILERAAKDKVERAAKLFGAMTAPNGRHALLGLSIALPQEDWELTAAKPQLCEWERVPPEEGEALPVELRLIPVATDPALKEEDPRHRLLERVALAFIERLPDGSFEGPAPEPHGASAPEVASFPAARVATDFFREVVVVEEETERRPYRHIAHGVFLPWAVSVLEVVAPRDEAAALLEKLLATASFEKPEKLDSPRSQG